MRAGMDCPRRTQLLLVMIGVSLCGCRSTSSWSQHSAVPPETVIVGETPAATAPGHCPPGNCPPAVMPAPASGWQTAEAWQSAGCPAGIENCQYSQPRELQKVSLPDYVIEPPDILQIEATASLRPATAPIKVGEALDVRVANTIPVDTLDDEVIRGFKTINNTYRVQADGTIYFGPEYGSVPVRGLTIAAAQRLIELHLRQTLRNPQVAVQFATDQAQQHVSGPHLVRPDGTVALGIYGSVYVAGLTLDQAKHAIERHLSGRVEAPEVSIDVLSYNSKVYYIVTDGGGAGEQVYRFPCTGNETVLDALAQINGLPQVASKKHIWIARPAPPELGHEQILDVDWDGIVRGGQAGTNFQILPGDRVYVRADDLITLDTAIAKITSPLERVLGFVLLGHGTFRAVQFGHRFTGGGGGGSP